MTHEPPAKEPPTGRYLLFLSLTALGVVFGDIGTSPLYALRESFSEGYGLGVSQTNILGVLSLIFWALIIVISLKYLLLVMRADNRGEGGIMALTALVTPERVRRGGRRWFIIMLGLFGAALLYGDSMITPAISVLSAVEGLGVATPALTPFVMPVTIVILVFLFTLQRRGTASVGTLFGPVTLLWFVLLGVLGGLQIVREPAVLAALDPTHAVGFFARNGGRGFLVLGSVFLVVTGGEALYADMGHFGLRPIRLTWFGLVLPALLLNYFGQGALLLRDPEAIGNPFFLLAPRWALYPLVLLATLATVIASQAVISGAFSLTRQALRLGYLPRMQVTQTSSREIGQIYIAGINWLLMIACIALVLGFRSSSNLAAAYGVGVTTDMVFTTILFAVMAATVWRWRPWLVLLLALPFLIVDLAFWGANLFKVPQGGWFPLAVGVVGFTLMTTWKRGRTILAAHLKLGRLAPETFLASIAENPPNRVSGTAIFMTGYPDSTPQALLQNLKHNHVLHERVVLLTVVTEEIPRVLEAQRETIEDLGNGFYKILLHYGFMEQPDVPQALANLLSLGFDPATATYFLGRETIIPTPGSGMALWRERLFAFMAKNALDAPAYFGIPPERVIEVGVRVEI